MNESRVLVAGATGQLGRVITRKLVASGANVRALARNREALAQFSKAMKGRRRPRYYVFIWSRFIFIKAEF